MLLVLVLAGIASRMWRALRSFRSPQYLFQPIKVFTRSLYAECLLGFCTVLNGWWLDQWNSISWHGANLSFNSAAFSKKLEKKKKNGERGSVFAACPDAQSCLCPGSLAGHSKKVFLCSEGSTLCSTHKQLMDIWDQDSTRTKWNSVQECAHFLTRLKWLKSGFSALDCKACKNK